MIKDNTNRVWSAENLGKATNTIAISRVIARVSLILAVFLFPQVTLPAHAETSALRECAACHGEDGVGKDVEIPNLAGQHEVYLFRQLQNFKSGKRPHKEMRYESRQLSEAEMQALAHYYAQLPR